MNDVVLIVLIVAVLVVFADLMLAGGAMTMGGMSAMAGAVAHPLVAGALVVLVIALALLIGVRF
jgi:hypothetical protein